jgi:hypothetical protein
MAQHHMSAPDKPIQCLWRAGCVDETHVRFGRRAEETHGGNTGRAPQLDLTGHLVLTRRCQAAQGESRRVVVCGAPRMPA